jgi:hypothetical protein
MLLMAALSMAALSMAALSMAAEVHARRCGRELIGPHFGNAE